MLQYDVSGIVTVGVVDLFKAVDIEEDQTQFPSITRCGFDMICERFLKEAAVVESGQPVACGLLAHREEGQP